MIGRQSVVSVGGSRKHWYACSRFSKLKVVGGESESTEEDKEENYQPVEEIKKGNNQPVQVVANQNTANEV